LNDAGKFKAFAVVQFVIFFIYHCFVPGR